MHTIAGFNILFMFYINVILIAALHCIHHICVHHICVQEVAVPEVLYEEVIEVDERVILEQVSCQLPRKDAKRIVTGEKLLLNSFAPQL